MNKDAAFMFVNCVTRGSRCATADRIHMISSKVSLQVQILLQLIGGSKKLSFVCFFCFDEGEEILSKQEQLNWFEGVKEVLEKSGKNSTEIYYVTFTREKKGKASSKEDSEIHKFINAENIKKIIRDKLPPDESVRTSFCNGQQGVPDKKMLHFKTPVFKTVDESLSVCLHDADSLTKFHLNYLGKAHSELITIPDFDRIELTKLYPLKPSKEKLEDYTCPGLHPGPSLYDYVGEIERFWQHFPDRFPNSNGVLMHSYNQDKLMLLLENENVFSFEFDWLY